MISKGAEVRESFEGKDCLVILWMGQVVQLGVEHVPILMVGLVRAVRWMRGSLAWPRRWCHSESGAPPEVEIPDSA
jgi:hypothetical protein